MPPRAGHGSLPAPQAFVDVGGGLRRAVFIAQTSMGQTFLGIAILYQGGTLKLHCRGQSPHISTAELYSAVSCVLLLLWSPGITIFSIRRISRCGISVVHPRV